jgi:hypothetical protein
VPVNFKIRDALTRALVIPELQVSPMRGIACARECVHASVRMHVRGFLGGLVHMRLLCSLFIDRRRVYLYYMAKW